MNNIKGFAIGKNYSNGLEIESLLLKLYAMDNKLEIKFFNNIDDITNIYIPFGNLNFIYKILDDKNIKLNIDYYPDFLKEYLHRRVWYTDMWPYETKCFIKSADKYKKLDGFIKESNTYNSKTECSLYACSEIINIDIEWRYYISNSKIVSAYQYTNIDDYDIPAPNIDINFPNNYYCGCLDFGISLDDKDKIILVESQLPTACGYYGPQSKYKEYIEWLIEGWKYIRNEYGI